MTKDEIVDTLNDLIQITEDSHEGYRKSAEDAEEQDLKSLFNDLSAQRGAMVRDLQKHVAEQGGAPEASGTVMGGAHRFFVGLKSSVMGRDRTADGGEGLDGVGHRVGPGNGREGGRTGQRELGVADGGRGDEMRAGDADLEAAFAVRQHRDRGDLGPGARRRGNGDQRQDRARHFELAVVVLRPPAMG